MSWPRLGPRRSPRGACADQRALRHRGRHPRRDPEARLVARQEASRPLIGALEPWLHASLETISQKTKMAEAIRYALSRLGRPDPVPGRWTMDASSSTTTL